MKINQYEIEENLQNIKLLGANDSLTVRIPFEAVKKHVFKDANATPEKNGLMSKEDKIKLDGLRDGSVTGVKGNVETSYRAGNVNITPANIGLGNVNNTSDANKPVSTAQANAIGQKLSKTGDTMSGHLHLGNNTMANSPNIYWNDKNRSVWAGTANDNGWFYLWDATNGRGILVSGKDGSGEVFGGNKASLRTDGEGGNLTLQSHDGSIGLEVDSFDDNGFRFYVYQVSPWKYLGDFSIDKNGTLYSSGGFSSFLKDADGAAYKIKAQYSGELGSADWICAWQDLGNNDIRIRAVRQGNLRVYNAARCGDMAPASAASGSTIMSRDGNGDTNVRYLNCNYLHSSQGVENGNIAHVIYQNGDGYYRTCSLNHLGNSLYNNGQLMSRNGGMFTGPTYFGNSSNWCFPGDGQWFFKSDRDFQFQPKNCAGDGALSVVGSLIYTAACFQYSARKFKENIVPVSEEDGDKILELEPVEFDYKDTGNHSSGLIADDVKQYFPDLIYYTDDEVTGLNYVGLIPYMLKKIQMQQKNLDEMNKQIGKLKEQLARQNLPDSSVAIR